MRDFLSNLIKGFFVNDVIGVSAQTAFYLTLSIPPMLALVLSISSNLAISGAIFTILEYIFPENISDILGSFLVAMPKSTGATLLSAAGVLFSASGSTWALMKGIHKAHTAKKLKYTPRNRLIAFLFTIALILLVAVSLGSVIIGSIISALFETLSRQTILSDISKRVFAVLGVYALVYLLYRFTPGVLLKGKDLFWGALFSAFCWVSVSVLFGTYVSHFTRYTTVYGGIGAFFILILWLFVISVIILVGAQINGARQNGRHNT